MSDIQLDNQGPPATPGAGTSVLYTDTTNKEAVAIDESGANKVLRTLTNINTSDLVLSTNTNTYLTGSSITIPPGKLRAAGARFRWTLRMTNSTASTGTTVMAIVVGTAGTTADTVRVNWNGYGAGTAAADTGFAIMEMIVQSGGNTANTQVEAILWHWHNLATTGLFNNAQMVNFQSRPATFDTTTAGLIVGLTCNNGVGTAWTFQHISVEATNL